MKRYFLGLAANYSGRDCFRQLFIRGREKDLTNLRDFLTKKYDGEAILCKNGRSGLALALKTYFKPGEKILVNGFTCYAVYEAIRAAKLTPVFVDIESGDLNFSVKTLKEAFKKAASSGEKPTGLIVQNSFGNPVAIEQVSRFAKQEQLTIIEDLAHCVGVKYEDGREAGTVGAASVFSFGKDKAIDTISGGAVVLRQKANWPKTPEKLPKLSDHLRARFYPLFGIITRALTRLHLGGILMRGLVKIHAVERSADNRLDLERRLSKFEARLALEQFRALEKTKRRKVLREFRFVRQREQVLKELKAAGYFFDSFWYERPVSPERYYRKVHFPEADCPNAVKIAEQIINLPTNYPKKELEAAKKIIAPYQIRGED